LQSRFHLAANCSREAVSPRRSDNPRAVSPLADRFAQSLCSGEYPAAHQMVEVDAVFSQRAQARPQSIQVLWWYKFPGSNFVVTFAPPLKKKRPAMQCCQVAVLACSVARLSTRQGLWARRCTRLNEPATDINDDIYQSVCAKTRCFSSRQAEWPMRCSEVLRDIRRLPETQWLMREYTHENFHDFHGNRSAHHLTEPGRRKVRHEDTAAVLFLPLAHHEHQRPRLCGSGGNHATLIRVSTHDHRFAPDTRDDAPPD